MRLWHSRPGRRLIILASVVLVILIAALITNLNDYLNSPKMRMEAFLKRNADRLDQIGGGQAASFNYGQDAFPEMYIYLQYLPGDEYVPPENYGFKFVSSSENTWRWEGGGTGSRGYVNVERLRPKWFYVEMYYPT